MFRLRRRLDRMEAQASATMAQASKTLGEAERTAVAFRAELLATMVDFVKDIQDGVRIKLKKQKGRTLLEFFTNPDVTELPISIEIEIEETEE